MFYYQHVNSSQLFDVIYSMVILQHEAIHYTYNSLYTYYILLVCQRYTWSCSSHRLTHCGLVTLYGSTPRSTLAQIVACCLMTLNYYHNQCWLIISEILWHSSGHNSTGNAQDILKMSLKISNLKLLPPIPGANELSHIAITVFPNKEFPTLSHEIYLLNIQ